MVSPLEGGSTGGLASGGVLKGSLSEVLGLGEAAAGVLRAGPSRLLSSCIMSLGVVEVGVVRWGEEASVTEVEVVGAESSLVRGVSSLGCGLVVGLRVERSLLPLSVVGVSLAVGGVASG